MEPKIIDVLFAPQRFDSEAASNSALVLAWTSFLILLEDDANHGSDADVKARNQEAFQECHGEHALYLGMHVELQRRGVAILNVLQVDYVDVAILVRVIRTCLRTVVCFIFVAEPFQMMTRCHSQQ